MLCYRWARLLSTLFPERNLQISTQKQLLGGFLLAGSLVAPITSLVSTTVQGGCLLISPVYWLLMYFEYVQLTKHFCSYFSSVLNVFNLLYLIWIFFKKLTAHKHDSHVKVNNFTFHNSHKVIFLKSRYQNNFFCTYILANFVEGRIPEFTYVSL